MVSSTVMFTGLVEFVGKVHGVRPTAGGTRLSVELGPLMADTRLGDSICISGACQTVAAIHGTVADFDAVPETLRRTTLGQLRAGQRVNLERSLAVGSRLGGHFVSGHVDGMARLSSRPHGADGEQLWQFAAPPELTSQMVSKGSIAIDGISLTLVEVTESAFSVALIPTTLQETTLAALAAGQAVNIETDMLGKYVRRTVAAMLAGGEASGRTGSSQLTMDKLRQMGFLD